MNWLRKTHKGIETNKETFYQETFFEQQEFIILFNEFKKKYCILQQDSSLSVFASAMKAAGSVGRVLSSSETMNMPEAKGKIFFNACQVFIKKHVLLITLCGNPHTYKLEVGVKFGNTTSLNKEYSFSEFSEEAVEKQIMECLKKLSVK